jgi:RNA polymerase sigma-70 factor, ECF subfamily
MPPLDEDRNLALQIARGSERAIEVLDNTHRGELERVARSRGLSPEDAKDVVQETIIATVTLIQSGQFRGQSSLRTLLFSILRNKIVDCQRKESDVEFVALGDPSEVKSTALARIEDIAGPPSGLDIKLMTEQALKSLPEEERLILLMNQMGGYTIEEISSIVRRPSGTVGRMLAEAKKMFREKLGEKK